MKTHTGDPIGYFEGNCHTEKKIGDNIIQLRIVKRPEPQVDRNQFYIRLRTATSIAVDGKPEMLAGKVLIYKNFHTAWLPGQILALALVEKIEECLVMG